MYTTQTLLRDALEESSRAGLADKLRASCLDAREDTDRGVDFRRIVNRGFTTVHRARVAVADVLWVGVYAESSALLQQLVS